MMKENQVIHAKHTLASCSSLTFGHQEFYLQHQGEPELIHLHYVLNPPSQLQFGTHLSCHWLTGTD